MQSRQLDSGPFARALDVLGTVLLVAGLAAALTLMLSYRHDLSLAIEQRVIPIWPVPLALCGMVLFLVAKLSMFRRRRFFTFGASAMSPLHTGFYLVGYALMIVGYAFTLGSYLLGNR